MQSLIPAKSFAQQVNDKQADEALRLKAYKSLESLAEQIGSLQSGENRARMGSNIARSLWPHNQAKAREMFATVTKEIIVGKGFVLRKLLEIGDLERARKLVDELLVAAATKLDGFDNRYLRNGEWNMTAEGGVGSLLTMLAQNAVYFAMCDFDRAMTLSSYFERREIRMMAQLKLAQGLLDGPPKKRLYQESEP